MRLSDHLSTAAILCGCQFPSREDALESLVSAAAVAYGWNDGPAVASMVREREAKMSTAIGLGIAVPHARLERLERIHLAIACAPGGVDFRAPDRLPVRLALLLVSPVSAPGLHVQALAMVSRIGRGLVDELVGAKEPSELLTALREWEAGIAKK